MNERIMYHHTSKDMLSFQIQIVPTTVYTEAKTTHANLRVHNFIVQNLSFFD